MLPPGVLVIVQVPVDGNPDKATLPVGIRQVGCVTVPVIGAEGFVFTVNGNVLLQPSDDLV